MSASEVSAEELDNLAEGLRRAHARAAGLPARGRREVLRLWLAHRLRARSRHEVLDRLRALVALLEAQRPAAPEPAPVEVPREPEPPAVVEVQRSAEIEPAPAEVARQPEPPSALVEAQRPAEAEPAPAEVARQPEVLPATAEREREVLEQFLRAYWGEDKASAISAGQGADRAAAALEELATRLRDLAGARGPSTPPLGELLDRLTSHLAGAEAAMRAAAQESFDRLFEALNPAAMEAQAGKKGGRLGPFFKSSVHEAWVEKFGQLEAYHRAGRLVADFRAVFQRHVKEATEEKTAP